jgi:hypothetical protein
VGGAANVLLRSAGGQVQLGRNGTYLGTFVAPTGQLELGDASNLTGMLYGRMVTLKATARLTWQPALDAFVATMVPVVAPSGRALVLATGGSEGVALPAEATERVFLPLTLWGEPEVSKAE